MSEQSPADRLALALEAMLAGAQPPVASDDQELAELLRIARDLRDLPRAAFKSQLRADLSRRTSMATTSGAPTHTSVQTLTVYLAVRAADELIDFAKRAFGATEILRTA